MKYTVWVLIVTVGIFSLHGAAREQPTRLRVTNNCSFPIWIQHLNVPDKQNVKLKENEHYDYKIPAEGLRATRFWPKIGCDASGNNCTIGQSMDPCPQGGCQPPIESKFEATWAAESCSPDNPSAECMTWYNASQVDGYTLPFTILVKGPDANKGNCVSTDASQLDLMQCPAHDNLSQGKALFAAYKDVDLRVFDPKNPHKIIGCMSPCKKLNYPQPWGYGIPEQHEPALHMCCPTDGDKILTNTCTWANKCATSQHCSDHTDPASVVHTRYVKALHDMAPDVYAYAYDDVRGLHQCTARTQFEVIFCPDSSLNT